MKTVGARVKFQDDCCWQGGRGRVLFLWCKTACFALRSRCFFHLGSGALIVSILSKPRPPSISHSKKKSLLVWLYFLLKVDLKFHSITYQPRIKTQSKKPNRHLVAYMLTHPTHLPYLWGHRGRKNMAETFALKLVGRRGNRILNWSWRLKCADSMKVCFKEIVSLTSPVVCRCHLLQMLNLQGRGEPCKKVSKHGPWIKVCRVSQKDLLSFACTIADLSEIALFLAEIRSLLVDLHDFLPNIHCSTRWLARTKNTCQSQKSGYPKWGDREKCGEV